LRSLRHRHRSVTGNAIGFGSATDNGTDAVTDFGYDDATDNGNGGDSGFGIAYASDTGSVKGFGSAESPATVSTPATTASTAQL